MINAPFEILLHYYVKTHNWITLCKRVQNLIHLPLFSLIKYFRIDRQKKPKELYYDAIIYKIHSAFKKNDDDH